MTKNPKYTFLLPAYKGRFLDEMLRSIQGQTYKDFKVIISDDCSPEDLRSICEPYLQDPRFTYRRNLENMGSKSLVSHWNILVDMCVTDYCIMASDDDVYNTDFLLEINELVKLYPNTNLFHARTCKIDANGNIYQNDCLYEQYQSQIDYIAGFANPQRILCVANFVYRTSILKKTGGFIDFPFAWKSDSATNILMANNGICNTSRILFSFRTSGQNITSMGNENSNVCLAKLEACYFFYKWFKKYIESLYPINLVEQYELKQIRDRYKGRLLGEMMSYYLCTNYNQFRTLYFFLKKEGALPNRYRRVTFAFYWVKNKMRNTYKSLF